MKYQINKKFIVKKNIDKILQKQNIRYINYKELLRSFIELQNKHWKKNLIHNK